ncbi:MAG TPA: endolytic transglycosylase MltG [Rhizomicrobium sp.]|nr:endolytic transglycosylase MltG [Rhizomicrobium sp.]
MRRFLILLILLGAIGAGAVVLANADWRRPGPLSHPGVVLIAPKTGTHAIASQLKASGVVANALIYEGEIHLEGQASKVKSGEYAVPAHASMAEVTAIMVAGKSIQHKITIAEGLTSDMAYKLVVANPVLVGDAGPEPTEGALLPETYLFTRGTTRQEMLVRMEKAQTKYLDQQWASRADGLPFAAPGQAVALASIVEKETALPNERRHVAAVFLNRLKQGMKLQSDPTIIYGITKGYPLGRPILESEIEAQTPYNTYAIQGLPPTPICNPGKDALAAVLKPEESGDLYFVANGKGGHVFASTEAEHVRNVEAWRAIERARDPAALAKPVAEKSTKKVKHHGAGTR